LAVFLFWPLGPGFRAAGGGAVPSEPPGDFASGEGSGKGNALSAELAGLKDRYMETLMACGQEPPPPDPAPSPSPPEEPSPAPREPEGGGAPPPPPWAGAATQAPEASPPPPPKPDDGEELTIPEGETDLAFLEGCWKSDAGMFSSYSGLPVTFFFCFSAGGESASVHMDEFDSDGGKESSCRGAAKATLSGGKVRIRTGMVRCEGKALAYVPRTVNCSPSSSGAAPCTFQSDGQPVFNTRITRQGR
jgi:hypothetical protein